MPSSSRNGGAAVAAVARERGSDGELFQLVERAPARYTASRQLFAKPEAPRARRGVVEPQRVRADDRRLGKQAAS